MNNVLKEIIFNARKVLAVPCGEENNEVLAMTAVRNLSDYGFIIDGQGIANLATASKEDITEWYNNACKKLNQLAGGDHEYKPFYPNFPEEVIEKSDFELFIDQICHYVSVFFVDITGNPGFEYRPDGENTKDGIKSLEEHPLKVMATIPYDEVPAMAKEIFENILKAKATPAPYMMSNIVNPYMAAVENWADSNIVITNRKVLSYVYTKALMAKKDTSKLPALVTNDYLRIVQMYSWMKENNDSVMSNLNIMDHTKQKIVSIPNYFRKFIANGLDSQKNLEEDVARNKEQWKIVFKLIHVYTMPHLKKLNRVTKKVRDNETLNTFYSKVEKLFSEKRYAEASNLLASRPGEAIKSFNRMLSVSIEDREEMEKYVHCLITNTRNVLELAKVEDLIRFINYLRSRKREDRLAVHLVKGSLIVTDKVYPPIPEATADFFINMAKIDICTKIKTGNPYGKVYIDPALCRCPLPTETSDLDGVMNAYTRGTRIPLERTEDGKLKNIRSFVWWTNKKDGTRVDLDLSANCYDHEMQCVGQVSYFNTFKIDSVIVHSGDITDGGEYNKEGATEYIDINIEELQKTGTEYVEVYINVYAGGVFKDIPCFGGWQEREELDQSQQFDIKAVKQTVQLNRNASGVIMAVIDIKNGEVIWMDSPDHKAYSGTNANNIVSSFSGRMDRYTKGDQMTMKEMAELSVDIEGGEIVESMEDADTIFSFDSVKDAKEGQEVITAKNLDIWMGRFMTEYIPEKEDEETEEKEKDENVAMNFIAQNIPSAFLEPIQ